MYMYIYITHVKSLVLRSCLLNYFEFACAGPAGAPRGNRVNPKGTPCA